MDVAIYLARDLRDARVLLGGVDVTDACAAVDVHASRGETTQVTLTLRTALSLGGTVERVTILHVAKAAEDQP